MSCAICNGELNPNKMIRLIMTPQGRQPAHVACYEKYLNIAITGEVPAVKKMEECEICHSLIDEQFDKAELVSVMGGFGFAHESCLIQMKLGAPTPEEIMAATTGTQVTKYDEKFAEMAAGYASGERLSGSFISTKGGVLTFAEEALPGNQMCVVILDAVQERTFYADKYDDSREFNLPPVCYAFKRNEDPEEMAPHPSMQVDLSYFQPQSDICRTCPNNQWGTADRGRGKACGERRRLALIPAGLYTPRRGSRDFDLHMIDDPAHYASADIAFLKLPVTSVKDWARYITTLQSSVRRPPAGVITRIYVEPDKKNQFVVHFEMLEMLPDTMIEVIMQRHEEAKASIIFGYPPPGEDADAPAAGKASIRR